MDLQELGGGVTEKKQTKKRHKAKTNERSRQNRQKRGKSGTKTTYLVKHKLRSVKFSRFQPLSPAYKCCQFGYRLLNRPSLHPGVSEITPRKINGALKSRKIVDTFGARAHTKNKQPRDARPRKAEAPHQSRTIHIYVNEAIKKRSERAKRTSTAENARAPFSLPLLYPNLFETG